VKNNVKQIIQIRVGLILLLLLIQILLFEGEINEENSTNSSQIQILDSDFKFSTLNQDTVTSRGELKSDLRINYIEDNFTDESKIKFKENVIVDKEIGEVRLFKIYKLFGGYQYDSGNNIIKTSDGGYLIGATTESFYGTVNSDIWIIKIDQYGNEEWNKTYGGWNSTPIGSNYDHINSLQATSDGGYLIIGSIQPFWKNQYIRNNPDIWLIKIDQYGNEQWNRTYGGNESDGGSFSQQTPDGGYIIVGTTRSYSNGYEDIWLIKTNDSGIMQWNKTFGGKLNESGYSVQNTDDGGFIILGNTNSYGEGSTDIWVIKTNNTGIMQWNKTYGGFNHDKGNSMIPVSDEGYIIVGETVSFGYDLDVWLIKIDENGDMIWEKNINLNDYEYGNFVQETSDDGYIIVGMTEDSNPDLLLIKTNVNGKVIWESTFDNTENDWGYSVVETSDHGFLVVGHTDVYDVHGSRNLDILLIKTDSSGNFDSYGNLYSKNLLENEKSYSINLFNYSSSIPMGTNIKVQFSQNNKTWYNSTGALNGWDFLKNGPNSIKLTSLFWNGTTFYYRMNFSSINMNLPSLRNINITYTKISNKFKIDTDNDNIPNTEDIDDDNDDMPDDWENQYGLNPLNSSDKYQDKDNDGFTNKEEYDADTDPSDPEDHPNEDNPIIDDDNNKKNPGKDYTIYVILIVIVIVSLIILSIIIGLKKKKG
jgi:hypothetical protein